MVGPLGERRVDRGSIDVAAPPERVFAAFADGETLMQWLPPDSMRGRALAYDFRVGGEYRFELLYDEATAPGVGKTDEGRDESAGRFVVIDAPRRMVWTVVFASDDPAFAGEMTMTWDFEPTGTGTRITVTAENVPAGISVADHQQGLDATLRNLARWAAGPSGGGPS